MKEILRKIPKNRIKKVKSRKTSHFFVEGYALENMKKIPSGKIDLIITDPPYNVGLDYGEGFNDKKPWPVYEKEAKEWLKECSRILDPNGSFYMITYPEIAARLFNYMEKETGLNFKRWIVWHYPTNIGHSKNNWTRSHRAILFFTKDKKSYTFNREAIIQPYKNPEVGKIKKLIEKGKKGRNSYSVMKPSDLDEMGYDLMDFLEINMLKNVSRERVGSMNKKAKDHHPCQLPLQLLEILVKVSSNKEDIVFDPFAGTFTLSAVAKKLDRNSIGIERNKEYIKLGKRRLKR